MTDTTDDTRTQRERPRTLASFIYERETREILFQILLVVALIALFGLIVRNTIVNMHARNMPFGIDFLKNTAGFDISEKFISYSNLSTYGRAFLVGITNTAIIAPIGIFFATILGFTIGIARLSSNWLVSKLAMTYVEILRNCPLLLQLLLWYFAVLKNLPPPIDRSSGTPVSTSYHILGGGLLNSQGLFLPKPEWLPGSGYVGLGVIGGIIASIVIARWAGARQRATGQQFPVLWSSLGLIVGLPLAVYLLAGRPLHLEYPELGRFSLNGGLNLRPEMVALLFGLVFYTASYIAEIVRGGIAAVPRGQVEAASAMGLTRGQTLRLVVVPQAMRVIIPPLTSQFLNLIKNSSLAAAVGFPDMTSVVKTIGNQTGQEVVTILMLMFIYLSISLLTSALMNWFNKRMALVER